MAYQGYLFKIEDYKVPLKYIEYKSYKATQVTQDLNSKRDTDGVLHRKVVVHKPAKCSFNLMAGLDSNTAWKVLKGIKDNYSTPAKKEGTLSIFVPEINDYVTGLGYLASETELTIESIDNDKNVVYYDSIPLTFVQN